MNRNISIISDLTGLVVKGDIDDHTGIQESWHKHEQGGIWVDEPVEIMNLGGGNILESVKKELVELLSDYLDVYTWSYEDMLRLDFAIVVHKLPTKEAIKPKR